MLSDNILDFGKFPAVPEKERQKRLFVNVTLDASTSIDLLAKGWEIVDVRLLPSDSDAERAAAVKAWLEGARQGSIILEPENLKHLELEAKICGLLGNKPVSTLKDADDASGEEDPEDILRQLLRLPSREQYIESRRGRKSGSKDETPRSKRERVGKSVRNASKKDL